MNYNFINKINGWVVFAIATIVYLLTIEDTASLWDCGEYITAAYKLEVGHPPGAPLYMILGRVFSFFAAPENVAFYINALSALSSSFTILFMFWSITLLLKKLILQSKKSLENHDQIGIFISASIGALAYTFTDSFWFSAVEGEVYAMASLFTAVIFWAILKWDEEISQLQSNSLANDISPNRWLLLILFLLGLAIGVHLLGILVIPAIGYVIYFRIKETTNKGFFITGVVSILILGFIQEGIIPGTISLASSFEIAFVNSLGLPFYSGSMFFFALLVAICVLGVRYARKNNMHLLSNSLMGLVFLLIGYGSFAVIVIRSNANTPLDENDPENLVTLHSYLKRDQYGKSPLISGPHWNSKESGGEFEKDRYGEFIVDANGKKRWNRSSDPSNWDDSNPIHLRKWVVGDGEVDLKGFEEEADAEKWMNQQSNNSELELEEKYFVTNADLRKNQIPTYEGEQSVFFPRMYMADAKKIPGYIYWSGYDSNNPDIDAPEGKDEKRLPTTRENLRYFMSYQMNWMYFRYFMWNFAGRQNDIQGHGDNMRGNWISGIDFIDEARLGSQKHAPFYTSQNKSNNKFYFIPLIFGLIGLIFHYRKAPKDAFVLTLAFFFTGIAIVLYLNQKPFEPRERDYAYAGSFYFFSMWISFGTYAIIDFLKSRVKINNPNINIGVAGTLGLAVPLILATQGWDDHDRSGKTTARDLAKNYLVSCEKNGILFTFGDNDTFPLWYMQEVEGYRTDVRVCNLSLMGTDWYTNQMKMKAYDSDPLPIGFSKDQILMYGGTTDVMYFQEGLYYLFLATDVKPENFKRLIDLRLENPKNREVAKTKYVILKNDIVNAIKNRVPYKDTSKYINFLNKDVNSLSASIVNAYEMIKKFPDLNTSFDQFDKGWGSVDLSKMMSYMEKDYFFVGTKTPEGGLTEALNLCPANSFTLKVNKKNAVASGIISKEDIGLCPEELSITIDAPITREQIMILDVLANFDWKRGIYFSSIGNEVAKSLAKYLKKQGVGYEFTPLPGNNLNIEKTYANLMKNYSFGNMADPTVITDYYARRHTSDYRKLFLTLANALAERQDTLRATKVLDRSLKIMPADVVLGFGDDLYGQPTLRDNYVSYAAFIYLQPNSNTFISADAVGTSSVTPVPLPGYQGLIDQSSQINLSMLKQIDEAFAKASYIRGGLKGKTFKGSQHRPKLSGQGTIHEYAQLYLKLGEHQKAKSLIKTLIKQYESVVNYFVNSDSQVLLLNSPDQSNSDILFAAIHGLHMMHVTAKEEDPLNTGQLLEESLTKVHRNVSSLLKKANAAINDDDDDSRVIVQSKLRSLERYFDEIKIIYDYGVTK